MRNVFAEVVEKIKTYFAFNNFCQKSCGLWDNVEKYGTTRQRMRFACRVTKATDTHSEYVILTAFPRQQLLRERASILRL
jgi:hypothetical protein